MFTNIAINEETNSLLAECIEGYKQKHDLKKGPAKGKMILEALKQYKRAEGF